jgi:membrane associated rhomboid family serine protease
MFLPIYDHNPIRRVRAPYVNYGLIATTVLVFLMTGGIEPESVMQAAFDFGFIPSVVNGIDELAPGVGLIPEHLTFVTYAFLHAGVMHLGGNLLFLWVFGDNIEDALGHLRYLGFYLVVAAVAALAHGLSDPTSQAPLVGASGAVAGVVGGYLVLHPRAKLWILAFGRIPLKLSARIVIAAWALFQLLSLYLAVPGEETVAWWAHIGGFVAGAVLVIVLRRPGIVLWGRDMPLDR